MPYPRLSYGFSLILRLNAHLYSPISNSCIFCEQQVERVFFLDYFGAESNSAESLKERRDVPTLRRWVNENGSQQATNVATSQRRDVATLRCQRDFSITIIKSKRDQNSRGLENLLTRAQKEEQQ